MDGGIPIAWVQLSPNRTSPRNHSIDTLTIHCYVGQVTAEEAGAWFARPETGASCNYVVDRDGRVGLIVPEGDRSWCSSSAANDHRAVTIEVASQRTHPYEVTAAAYESLIALCADICRRNGIPELRWRGDKALIGQTDRQNMTVHRWFANKACPGEYLYSRMGEIAQAVNRRLREEEGMTGKEIYQALTAYLGAQEPPPWALAELEEARAAGLTDGTDPMGLTPRYQAAILALRAMKRGGSEG